MIYTFDDLLKANLLPKNARLVTKQEMENYCVPYSVVKANKAFKKVRLSNKIVIADDASWVARTDKNAFTYCRDGSLWITSQNKFIVKNSLQEIDGELTRIPERAINFKEEKDMANESPNEVLQNLIQNSAQKSSSIAEKKGKTAPAGPSALDQTIAELTANLAQIKQRDRSAFTTFNRKLGTFVAYIVPNEPKVTVTTVKEFVMNGKDRIAADDASAAVKQAIAGHNYAGLTAKDFKRISALRIRQSGTGAIKGAIIQIPEGGLVSRDELVSNESTAVPVDLEKKDLAILALSKDQAISFIVDYFGEKIAEDPRTHANPGTLEVRISVSRKKEIPDVKFKLVSSNRKKLIEANNYIPQRVYKTVALSDVRSSSDEEKAKANEYLFANIFAKTGKYAELKDESKNLFSKEGDTISSVFINGSEPMHIADFITGETIANPQIPIKEKKVTQSGKVTYRYVYYDVLKPNPELEELNPQTNPRYKTVVSALGGKMTVAEAIGKVIPKAKAKRSQSSFKLSEIDAQKLIGSKFANKATGYNFNINLGQDTSAAIASALVDAKLSNI